MTLGRIVFDSQVDARYTFHIQSQIEIVIKSLNNLILDKDDKEVKANWYEVFLTMLVLLSILESVYEM